MRISIVARSHDPRIVRCEFSLIDRPRVRHPTEGEVPGRTLKGVPIKKLRLAEWGLFGEFIAGTRRPDVDIFSSPSDQDPPAVAAKGGVLDRPHVDSVEPL